MSGRIKIYGLLAILFLAALACNAPASDIQPTPSAATQPTVAQEPVDDSEPIVITHAQTPQKDAPAGALVADVESSGTAPEKRAPYGDSYDINLLERPFLQDMTYVPDLDIESFSISQDDNWYYASIKLVGQDPNNAMGIDYAVELDTDKDGFGDFIILAQPPYLNEWTTGDVQVFADKNHDTAGLSATKSDAPFSADGYETPVFDGTEGMGADPDLAWARMTNDGSAVVQIAFKRSLVGDVFMLGAIADAGLKDVTLFDYVDRFTETEAGSPVKNKQDYPLQALNSVDNTCREAFGFVSTGYEPMSCMKNAPTPSGNDNSSSTPAAVCDDPQYSQQSCSSQGLYYWPPPHCACSTEPFNP
jgi:hypothetical protein